MALQSQEQVKMAESLLFDQPASSFAKSLYFGRFDKEKIYPFPMPTEQEQKELLDYLGDLRTFLDQEMNPEKIDEDALIPESLIQGLGEKGVLGLTVPKEYGGLGLSQYAYCLVMQEIAARCGSTAVFINAHQSIGLRAILLFGDETQKLKYLPDLAKGKKIAAFALTEEEAGSDAANVQTSARYDASKDCYVLNGQKRWITNGGIAQVLTVMAKTEDGQISAFLVTPDMKGFHVLDKAMEKWSIRGTQTGRLLFEEMEVPAKNLLGPKGKGLKVALTVLDYGRLTFGSSCTGQAKEVLKRVLPHAKSRRQFQQSLSAFPMIKEKISLIAAYHYAMESACLLTADFVDRGEEDLMLETAILKVFASDALWHVVNEGMQVLGGKSFFDDEPFGRMLRDARLNLVGEGANEVLRNFIGLVGMRDVGVGLQSVAKAFKHPFKQRKTLFDFGKQTCIKLLKPPLEFENLQELKEEVRTLRALIKKFYWSIQKVFVRHREKVLDRQLDIRRIASMAMNLYMASAVLSRLATEKKERGGLADFENELKIGQFFCRHAFLEIQKQSEGLFSKLDHDCEALSDHLISKI